MQKQRVSLLAIVTMVVAIVVGCSNTASSTTQPSPASRYSTLDTPTGKQLQAIATTADEFVASEFPTLQPVGHWMFVPADMHAETPCGNQYDDTSSYCVSDNTVYIGEQLAIDAERIAGQTALHVIVGFEIGRYIQTKRGAPPQLPSLQNARAADVQADCYSGSLAHYAREHGIINDPLKVDPRPLYSIIESKGDRAGTFTTNPETRYLQFYIGALDGAFACNSYNDL